MTDNDFWRLLMTMPNNLPAIDLCLNIPGIDDSRWYEFISPLLMDQESREIFKMPVQYMFKDIPESPCTTDYIDYTIAEMDKQNIKLAMLDIDNNNLVSQEAIKRYPDRFFTSFSLDPNNGIDEVARLVNAHEKFNLKAATSFPAGTNPQTPINDKKWYPLYSKLNELGIPICICVGVPGPRIPMSTQKVEFLDEICWWFPNLKIVMRHGGEPWTELACKLMLKYPNLYYSTSAFSPKYYPKDIIDFANNRGSEKIMYAGYFPMGLSLERIFHELQDVPFKKSVWPRFLHKNAEHVFNIHL